MFWLSQVVALEATIEAAAAVQEVEFIILEEV
jgi:hypothetical protein